MASLPGKDLTQELIMRRVFDENNLALRTTATIVAPGGLEVNLSAADGDNVAISDGTDTLAINADGSINANIGNISISHLDDSIRLGDGSNFITSTSYNFKNGLDVNIIAPVQVTTIGTPKIYFDDILSVANNNNTIILSKTLSVDSKLQKIECSGTNVAKYEVVLNGNVISRKYTYFGGQLNLEFLFSNLDLLIGDLLIVQVEHFRPNVGDFNATLHVLE